MSELRAMSLLERIGQSIAALERAPRMFGSAEAQEAVLLTLVEVRQQLVRPDVEPGEVAEAYERFVEAINGDSTNWTLASILRESGQLEELPRLLGDFARWVTLEHPPERGEKAEALAELLERARAVVDGSPISDRSGATDDTRIESLRRALESYEAKP